MKRTEKRLTDDECRQILIEIVKIIIGAYKNLHPDFEKRSRAEQCGYDITRLLLDRDIITFGQSGQERLNL